MKQKEQFYQHYKIRFYIKIWISGFSEVLATVDPNSGMVAMGWCCKDHPSGRTYEPQFTGGPGDGLRGYQEMARM